MENPYTTKMTCDCEILPSVQEFGISFPMRSVTATEKY